MERQSMLYRILLINLFIFSFTVCSQANVEAADKVLRSVHWSGRKEVTEKIKINLKDKNICEFLLPYLQESTEKVSVRSRAVSLLNFNKCKVTSSEFVKILSLNKEKMSAVLLESLIAWADALDFNQEKEVSQEIEGLFEKYKNVPSVKKQYQKFITQT